MPKPYRLTLPLLAVLAESEVWVIPRPHSESHPYALAFYVPARVVDLMPDECLAPASQSQPHRPGACLRLVP
jgi:hypothetical protein